MSFTDQKQRIATDSDVQANWNGGKNGEYFRCGFCGHKFSVGDKWRFVYTNDIPGAAGNPLVCESCDAARDELIARWKKMHEDVKTKYWWFVRGC